MRKTIQVVGIGSRKVGVAKKSGEKYDFTEVSIVFEDKKFSGQKAETIPFDQDLLVEHPIAVGEVFDAEIYSMNFKTRIACIYG